MASEKIQIVCPCCHSELTVEPSSGLVVSHRKKQSGYSFDEALEKERERKSKADELFAKAFDNEKQRVEQLEKKFKEAIDSKDELDDPIRPFDFD